MTNPANDDLKARVEAFIRRSEELQRRAALPGLSEADQAELAAALATSVDEGNEVARLQLEHKAEAEALHASLLRELKARGFPTLRRVVEDGDGNTVIF